MLTGLSGLYASRTCLGARSLDCRGDDASAGVCTLLGADSAGSARLVVGSFTGVTGCTGAGWGCSTTGVGSGLGSGNLDGLGCRASSSSCTQIHSSPLGCISQNQSAPGLFGKSTGATGAGFLDKHPASPHRTMQLITRNMGRILCRLRWRVSKQLVSSLSFAIS